MGSFPGRCWFAGALLAWLLPWPAMAAEPQGPEAAVPAGTVPTPPEPEWVPPSPPPLPPGGTRKSGPCPPAKSHPIVSYRISAQCSITDVRPIGSYRYGVHEVEGRVRGFRSSKVVRRFVHGSFRYEREVTIELHRAVQIASHLVCHVDMMGKRVLDAKIVRRTKSDKSKEPREVETPLTVSNGQLPELGVYTYGADVPYPEGACPADH